MIVIMYIIVGGLNDEKNLGISREILSKALNAEGFPHGIGYIKPLYQLPMFKRRL